MHVHVIPTARNAHAIVADRSNRFVFVPPPGRSALDVTPVPSSDAAIAATNASCVAFDGP